MKLKLPIPWLIIAVLIGLLFLQRECGNRCPDAPVATITHDTVPGDTVAQIVRVDKPYPVFTVLPPDTFKTIDSAKCMALAMAYYSRVLYCDTLLDDSSAFVAVLDTVYKNALQHRRLLLMNKRATEINNYVTISSAEKPRNKLFIGPAIGRAFNDFALGGSVLLVTKKYHAYSYTYDITNQDQYLSFYWKLHVKGTDKKQ